MDILIVVVAALLAVHYYFIFLTSTFNFWKSRGVRGPRPIPIFGTMKDVLLLKTSMREYMRKLYRTYKDDQFIGIYARRTPILVVKDPNLFKDILIKDFPTFADRGVNFDEKAQPLSAHIFHLESKRWRPLRTKLTPVFTSGKLKQMFSIISECADHLEKYTEKLACKDEPVECHELSAKYTTDVIGSCAFGIEMNSLTDENAEIRKMGKLIFAPTWTHVLIIKLKQFVPNIFSFLSFIGIIPTPKHIKFFMRVIHENIDYREKNNIVRHDFVDVLRNLKKEGKVGNIKLTDNLIAAQAFLFFIAGFETSSAAISGALYELALHPKIQDQLRKEINEMYKKHGSNLTYENVKEMSYLDKVFKESLRKYPAGTVLMRKTTSSYTFNGTNVTIPKKHRILIPVAALHYDPDIYPEPDVFDPERFSDEAVKARHPMCFLPFGEGPRNCMGLRFAVYQVKIALIKLLRNYKFETCEKTQIPYRIDPKVAILTPLNGIYLKVTAIGKA